MNLFKEIAIDVESLTSLSDGLFVKIGKSCHYPSLQFIFGIALCFAAPHV